ncbi:VrrA/YqfQ family protein [Lysinibacillus xylanilyticus]|uniref:VrrA/YqfQ family protein n=1 Tax=Lysinibacillus xylanilyticus TaxID=582475 RepID=A0ABV3VW00_9BACI
MVFRPPYQFPMYPGGMRMPMQMQMPMPMQMPMQMQMPTPMSPQSFFTPGGFPNQPRIPGGFPMSSGIGTFGGQMPMPPVQDASKIGSFLQNANNIFNTAKTYTPYIQQAMPMVKNIPSLLKLYKGFQGLPSVGTKAGAGTTEAAASNGAGSTKSRSASQQNASFTPPDPLPSKPRIFQPPM